MEHSTFFIWKKCLLNSLVNLPCGGVGQGMHIAVSKCTLVCMALSSVKTETTIDDEAGFLIVLCSPKSMQKLNHLKSALLPFKVMSF